jgi:CDP-paratose 2-epimerase
MNSEKILITGGCGFVGSNLALAIKNEFPKAEITVMDNLYRKGSELNISRIQESEIKFVKGDIRFEKDFEGIGEVTLIIEAAAEPSVLSGINSSPDYVIQTNFNGTVNCLNFAKKHNAKFVFLSTSRVYPIHHLNNINYSEGDSRFILSEKQILPGVGAKGISENFPLDGSRSFYGSAKLASEMMIQEYAAFYNVKAIINRCGVLTGPWQMGKVDQGVIVLWLAKHFWKGELGYFGFGGSGLQVRDMLHVMDLYELLKMQIANFNTFEGNIFNVGGGSEVSVSLKELTEWCEKITGNRIKINSVKETRTADVPVYITDNTRINKISGWAPKYNVEKTLIDIFDWIKKDESKLKTLLN